MMSMRKKKRISPLDLILNIVIIIFAVLNLFPLYWMISSSFKNANEVLLTPPTFFPQVPTIQNYIDIIQKTMAVRWLFNSLFVAFGTTVLIVIFSSMAAYAFSKLEFFGRDFWFFLLIGTLMIPKEILVVPMFRIVKSLNWMNSYEGLIIPGVATAVGVFMLKQFFTAIPDALREAAKIDGCSELGIFIRIILPLGKAGIGALAILQFVTVWNDYLWQLVIAQTTPMQTLLIGIASMMNEDNPNFAYKYAGAAIGAIPMILIFILFQKNFTRGITIGGVKE
jgi:multiple sugar transport system permease protein